MKKGKPTTATNETTGISNGAKIILLIKSVKIINEPPTTMDIGMIKR